MAFHVFISFITFLRDSLMAISLLSALLSGNVHAHIFPVFPRHELRQRPQRGRYSNNSNNANGAMTITMKTRPRKMVPRRNSKGKNGLQFHCLIVLLFLPFQEGRRGML